MPANTIERLGGLLVMMFCLCCVPSLAQTDGWVPANSAAVVPNQLAVFTCNSNSGVNARLVFKGDFIQAEMVKAFISSAKYRNRF